MKSLKKAASRTFLMNKLPNNRKETGFSETDIKIGKKRLSSVCFEAIARHIELHNKSREHPIRAQIVIGCDGIINANYNLSEAVSKTLRYYSNNADMIRAISDANRAAHQARALDGLPLGWTSPHLLDNQAGPTASALIKNLDPANIVYRAPTLTVYLADWRFLFVNEMKRLLDEYVARFTYYEGDDRAIQVDAFLHANHHLRRAVCCIRQYKLANRGVPVGLGEITELWYALYPEARFDGHPLAQGYAKCVNSLHQRLYPSEGDAIILP